MQEICCIIWNQQLCKWWLILNLKQGSGSRNTFYSVNECRQTSVHLWLHCFAPCVLQRYCVYYCTCYFDSSPNTTQQLFNWKMNIWIKCSFAFQQRQLKRQKTGAWTSQNLNVVGKTPVVWTVREQQRLCVYQRYKSLIAGVDLCTVIKAEIQESTLNHKREGDGAKWSRIHLWCATKLRITATSQSC